MAALQEVGPDVLAAGITITGAGAIKVGGKLVGSASDAYKHLKATAGINSAGLSSNKLADYSGILRNAAKNKGNFGLGSSSNNDAIELGKAWVGKDYKIASDGKTLISKDGLKQFRPPSYKPKLGSKQANFEWRNTNEGAWQGNGHLDIIE